MGERDPAILTIEVDEPSDGLFVVTLAGELDIASAAEPPERIGALRSNGPFRVVVDLTRLAFVDSSGLNGIVEAARAVEANGGWIVFAGASPHVAHVFAIVRLGDLVALEPSVEQALRRAEAEATPGR